MRMSSLAPLPALLARTKWSNSQSRRSLLRLVFFLNESSIEREIAQIACARCAILKATLKPKTNAEAAVEIADALKASKDGRLPSDYFGEAVGNLGELLKRLTTFVSFSCVVFIKSKQIEWG